jgi:hypothetical protein
MSVSSLADPAIRGLYGIADKRHVETLERKVNELTELVSTLQKEIHSMRLIQQNFKDVSGVKITQNASAGTNK